ncbi:hypothetical protein B0J14DRAFT_558512 [Halenospora varia]|nr:hypothetical protein B0J14DRAFT_558512 [Halenospora varia]
MHYNKLLTFAVTLAATMPLLTLASPIIRSDEGRTEEGHDKLALPREVALEPKDTTNNHPRDGQINYQGPGYCPDEHTHRYVPCDNMTPAEKNALAVPPAPDHKAADVARRH